VHASAASVAVVVAVVEACVGNAAEEERQRRLMLMFQGPQDQIDGRSCSWAAAAAAAPGSH
jgi:hypothetical protein